MIVKPSHKRGQLGNVPNTVVTDASFSEATVVRLVNSHPPIMWLL